MGPNLPKQRISHLVTGALAALTGLAIFTSLAEPFVEGDFWGYLLLGRRILETGSLPTQTPYIYLISPRPYTNHNWVSSLLFTLIYTDLSPTALQIFRFLAGFATAGVLYKAARIRGAGRNSSLAMLFLTAVFFGSGFPPVLARMFSSFFFALFLLILEMSRKRNDRRLLWWLPALGVAWANLHMGLSMGLFLMFWYAIAELGELSAQGIKDRRGLGASGKILGKAAGFWLALGLCTALAGTVTPYGWKLWVNFLTDVNAHPEDWGGEWMKMADALSTGFDLHLNLSFIVTLLATLLLAPVYLRRDVPALVNLSALTMTAFNFNRHASFFILACSVYLPLALDGLHRDLSRTRKSRNCKAYLTCVLLLLALGGVQQTVLLVRHGAYVMRNGGPFAFQVADRPIEGSFQSSFYPVGAARFLASRKTGGTVATRPVWGSFLAYFTYPKYTVAADGRFYEEFPRQTYNEYMRFMDGLDGWEIFLRHHPPDFVLCPAGSRLDLLLSAFPEFLEIYRDPFAAVFSSTQKK
ncbi:MAG: hypothetical protein AB1921_14920 [Thermodesulfobacteriota bacterium]